MPRVSINLCCYNSEPFLERTLRSIAAQTYKDWELVVINDGSTDATEAILQRFIEEGWPVRYDAQPNRGIAEAHNEALRRSSGELIAFIDHDDEWTPTKLERQVPLFDRNPRTGLVYSDCINLRDDGFAFRQYDKLRPFVGEVFGAMLSQYFLTLTTAVVRRQVVRDHELWFDPAFKLLPDADFFLRVAFHCALDFVNEPLARIRIHRQSTTQVGRQKLPVELRALLEKQRRIHADFDHLFAADVARFQLGLARTEARIAWEFGQRQAAVQLLRPYRRHSFAAAKEFFVMRCVPYAAYDRLRVAVSRLRPHPGLAERGTSV